MTVDPDWYTSTNVEWLVWQVWPFGNAADTPAHETTGPLARRLRLFATGCVREVWGLLPREVRNAVEVAERLADGRASGQDLRAAAMRAELGSSSAHHAREAARNATADSGDARHAARPLFWDPLAAARAASRALATKAAGQALLPHTPAGWHEAWNAAYHAARAVQADILRDIFPPPGYTPAVRPEWRASAVLDLARAMDAAGDFSAAPILADALQDAGCDDDVMLNQLRHPGPHVRGCWPADAVLGR